MKASTANSSRRVMLLCASLAALCLLAPRATHAEPPAKGGAQAAFTLRPVRDSGEVTAIDVTLRLDRADAGADRGLKLSVPLMYPGAWKVADRVEGLKVVDADGEVPMSATDDPPQPGGFPSYRRLTATRPIRFPATVSYRAKVQPAGQPNGPPFGIRPSAGGVSGAAGGFLVLPEGFDGARTSLDWDLSNMPKGSFGVTSYGEGAVTLPGGPSSLMQTWMLSGPAGRYPAKGDAAGFSAAWLGAFDFDPETEMKWAASLYGYIGKTFGYLKPPPRYRVFMRFLQTQPVGGGTALSNSFMLSTGVGARKASLAETRVTIAHEMMHQWTGSIEGPNGVVAWFVEGLNVYNTAVVPLRGGFTSPEEFGRQINQMANGYWGSAARDWPAARIAEKGFTEESTRQLPYNRGALYFADLDAKIRAKSGGKRTLYDVLVPLFERRHAGERFDQAAWIKILDRELGPEAVQTFLDVNIEGRPFTPDANAFGPCFERQEKTYSVGGAPVAGYAWIRRPGVPDATCRAWYAK